MLVQCILVLYSHLVNLDIILTVWTFNFSYLSVRLSSLVLYTNFTFFNLRLDFLNDLF